MKKNSKFERLRLSVNRSLKNISAQIIDDKNNKTLVSASSIEKVAFSIAAHARNPSTDFSQDSESSLDLLSFLRKNGIADEAPFSRITRGKLVFDLSVSSNSKALLASTIMFSSGF